MNKFIKFTIGAVVVLLIVSLAHGLEARTKGLPPLVARQDPYGDAPKDPKTADSTSTPGPTTTLLGKIPIPDATPTDSIDTFSTGTTYSPLASGVPSGVPSGPQVSAYAPSGTGSLIPQWASLTAKGGVPSNPTSAPAATTTPKSADAPSSAHKIELGLINVAIIAGIVSYFF